ncbi:MAG: acetylxylan esterase [Fimbriimonadaceae bacterium]|nr:acetylxylan esterase [Fimbriimonadaceae bacterium]
MPADLESFWHETTDEAGSAPLDYSGPFPSGRDTDTHRVEVLTFRGMGGSERHAWVAFPHEAPRGSFLWVPPYSRWSMKPNEYGTRDGYVSLSPNLLGESAFHDEVYTPARGYFADGAASPATWVFRRLYQDSLLATRVLQALTGFDHRRTGAMGMSQGGGVSVWLGAWSGAVGAVVADMPFLGKINEVMAEDRPFRYPLKELADWRSAAPERPAQLARTLSVYDTAVQAAYCRVPTLVTLGLRDPAVRPFQAEAVYDALSGPKELVRLDWGHDWHPSMVQRNLDWLDRHLTS